jgi:hypothetical protein
VRIAVLAIIRRGLDGKRRILAHAQLIFPLTQDGRFFARRALMLAPHPRINQVTSAIIGVAIEFIERLALGCSNRCITRV